MKFLAYPKIGDEAMKPAFFSQSLKMSVAIIGIVAVIILVGNVAASSTVVTRCETTAPWITGSGVLTANSGEAQEGTNCMEFASSGSGFMSYNTYYDWSGAHYAIFYAKTDNTTNPTVTFYLADNSGGDTLAWNFTVPNNWATIAIDLSTTPWVQSGSETTFDDTNARMGFLGIVFSESFYVDYIIMTTEYDDQPPMTNKTFTGSVWAVSEGLSVTNDTQICFHAIDNITGAAKLYIEVMWDSDGDGLVDTQVENITVRDNGSNDTDATSGNISYCLNFTEECIHEVRYYSIDHFGNIEEEHLEIDLVDNTPPITIKEYGSPFYVGATVNWSGAGAGDVNHYITSNTPIYLNTTDYPVTCASGVNRTEYKVHRWNGSAFVLIQGWTVYTDPFNFSSIGDTRECLHRIKIRSFDNLGHNESEWSQYVMVDNTPPESIKEIGTPKYGVNDSHATTNTPIWLNVSNDNGVRRCQVDSYLHYKIWWDSNNNGVVDTLVEDVTVVDNDSNDANTTKGGISCCINFTEECYHEIHWYSADYLGNQENWTIQPHYVDDTPPVTIKTYGTPFNEGTPISWITTDWSGTVDHYINSSTLITLTTTDYPVLCASGVKWTRYIVYWWNETTETWIQIIPVSGWKKYTTPFTIGVNEGLYRIRIRSSDNLGNIETAWDQYVMVDNTPPTTTKEYGSPFYVGTTISWDSPFNLGGYGYDYYPNGGDVNHYITSNTLIYLNTTDTGLGVNRTEYKVYWWNGTSYVVVQPWTVYTGPFSLASIGDTHECLHRIRIRSFDNGGNTESTWRQYVMVDNSPPASWKEHDGPLNITEKKSMKINTTLDIPYPLYGPGNWIRTNESVGFVIPQVFGNDITFFSGYPWLNYVYWASQNWSGTTTGDLTGDIKISQYLILNATSGVGFSQGNFTYTDDTGTFNGYYVADHNLTIYIGNNTHGRMYATGSGGYTGQYFEGEFNGSIFILGYLDVFWNISLDFAYTHWITTDTQITLNATDLKTRCSVGSYQSFYRYYLDGTTPGAFIAGPINESVSFNITNTGHQILEWYVVDDLGTESDHYFQRYYVDDAAPEITVEVGNPSYGSNVTTGTPFWINVTDDCNLSYARVWCQYDTDCDGTFNTQFLLGEYVDTDDDNFISVQVNFSEECCHRWVIRAWDATGKDSGFYRSPWYHVDDTPPVTTKEIGRPRMIGGLFVTTGTPIWLNTTDGTGDCDVGCAYLHYEVWWDSDGDDIVDTLMESDDASSNNVTIYFTETCYHELWWYGVDYLGNNETLQVQPHYVDDAAPEITIEMGNPSYGSNVTTGTPFWINVTDDCNLSYARVWYQYDANCSGTFDTQLVGEYVDTDDDNFIGVQVNFSEECCHRWVVRAWDATPRDFNLYISPWYHVDDTPPMTTKEIGIPQYYGVKGWNISTVDSIDEVGEWTSLALDSNDYPHISYYDNTTNDLKYAYWNGATWQIITVDAPGDVGFCSSLALDSNGYPHISYLAQNGSQFDLRYAYWNGTTWNISTVTPFPQDLWYDTSLALDSNDYAHISYIYDDWVGGVDAVRYTYWDGANWQSPIGIYGSFNSKSSLSLALNSSDYPRISYYEGFGVLKYAYWDGATWNISTVDSIGDVGAYNSLALDSSDYPHISYYNGTPNGDLKYAYTYWYGTIWQNSTVDSTDDVGLYTSLALDSNDYPRISYYDQTNKDLKCAFWDGATWAISTVDSTDEVGLYTSLALDNNDYPHISYYDQTNKDLKYAYWYTSHCYVTTGTPIWLNTTDGTGDCAVGCAYLHYEVWWDSDSDGTVDMLMESGNESSNNVTIVFTETCYHEIWWYGVDYLGNTENITRQQHYVDDAAPEITIEVGDPSYGINVTTGTPFWINITDDCNLSYARVTYQYDTGCDGSDGTELIGVFYDTDDDNVISLQVNFTEECCHRWRVRAYDEFGRDSGWILSPWYRVDDTPPVTTKEIGLPRRMGGLFVTTDTPIWLNTTDETIPCAVGCAYLHYEVWWDSDGDRVVDTVVESGNASSNNVTIYFNETCYHEIWWYGVDYLGNTETLQVQSHYVDDAAPEITIEVGDPSYGINVTTGTPFWINITDDCNLSYARVTYQYDTGCDGSDGTELIGVFYDTDDDNVISLQVNFTEECCHRWRVIAYDEWGRDSGWILSPWYRVDDTPPVTTKEIGNPQSGGGLYVTTSTPIWLNTTDETVPCAVGCAYLHYEVWWDSDGDGTVDTLMESDDASSNNVTIYFTETCYHEIWWYGVDFFGNTETMHVQGHYVDETPPVTAHEFGIPYYTDGIDEWITTSTLIYLNATDKGPCQVGDYALSFRVWDMVSGWGPWVPGTPSTNMTLTVGEEGQHYIEFFAVDYLGNTAPLRNISFYVDDTPPTTTKEYGSPFCVGATVSWPDGGDVNHYITSDTFIYLNATDNLGVNRTEYFIYRWDGSAFVVVQPWTVYMDPFSFASIGDTNECLHRIWVRSYDTLGNLETQWSQHVMVDNTPPETTKEIGSPRRSGGLYVTTYTPIWLNTTDTGTTRCKVGCNYTHYEIWWDSDGDHVVDMLMESGNASSNNVTIYFTETCYHEIWWYGVDFLGNTETMHVQRHYVDDAAPEITLQVGHPRYNDGGYVYVTTDTPFWINITDDCNLSYARVWYQYDTNCDGTYVNEHLGYFYDTDDDDVISLQLNFPQNGCHRWRAQAFDMYGRETGNWYSGWYRVIDAQPQINITGTPNQLGHEGIPVTCTAGVVTANITFNATITLPITGPELYDNLTYYWDWNNDGIYDEGPFDINTADHTWPDDYTENVNVQVRYKYGGMDNDTCIITILNIPPTAPTDIIIDPPFFSLGDILEATAIGSTDVPADIPLTYWYLFYDVTTDSLIQDWSTVNSIVITASLENHIILIKSRAHDKDSGISAVTQVTATSDSSGVIPIISINPVSSTVIQGNDFCIEIHVDSAGHSLLTAGFQLTYPTIFTVKSFTYENLLGTSILELGTPPVGDTSGLINYAVSRTDGGADPENGTLVTICFTAPGSPGGPYPLDLHDVILVDGTGATISGIVVTDGTVTVNPPSQCLCRKGDYDKDCYIGPIDLTYFATSWGKSPGQAGYSECFDMDDSGGAIDAIDLFIFASHWGETYCDCSPCNAPPWQQWP